jgi:hypothetical protein
VHWHIYAPVLPFVITIATVATAAIVFRKRAAVGGLGIPNRVRISRGPLL